MRYRCKKGTEVSRFQSFFRSSMVLPSDAQAIPLTEDEAAAATTPIFYSHVKATELIKWSAKVTSRMRKKLAASQVGFSAGRGCLVFENESEIYRTKRFGGESGIGW